MNNHQPITDPKPINPSTTTTLIKPITDLNPLAPIKKTQLHHQKNPATTKQTHHNTGQQPPRKTHKKTTTNLAIVDLEIHQP